MLKILFVVILFIVNLLGEEKVTTNQVTTNKDVIDIDNSFITKFEYGKMLYNNPRGIGCNTCHGEKAEGKKMVNFKQEHDNKIYNCSLVIPSITETDYETFYEKVNSKKNPNKKFEKEQVCEKLVYYANVMPTYFLVDDEIEAIYYYIQKIK